MSLTLWQTASHSDQPLPKLWIEKLFNKLRARYGTLFTDRFGGLPLQEVQDEWASELAGYTGEEITRGLAGLRTCKFPPTLPEFMELCRQHIDAQAAFSEACRNLALREQGEDAQWSSPAIYWAAIDVGWFDVRNSPYPVVKSRWEKALAARAADRNLQPVPVALKALPPPDAKPSPEIASEIKALVEKMKMKDAQRKTDENYSTGT